MKTILVSGASGIVGYGTLRSLQKSETPYRLIGTTIYSDSVAPAFCDVFEQAPLTSDAGYLDWLIEVINKHNVDMIIPGIDIDLYAWNDNRRQIVDATGVAILLNNQSLINLCRDKWSFYEKLHTAGIEEAIESRVSGDFTELRDAFGLPFIMKPRQGFASKGIVIVENEEDFTQHKHKLGEVLMAQPIVGDKETEYTVSAFFDNDSKLCGLMSLRRKLAKEGFTEKAEVSTPEGVETAIEKIAGLLMPVGPTNFQFRVHDGQLKLLEINPRISSATSIRTAFGYNESVMAAQYVLEGIAPVQPTIRNGYAVRYTEDYIFYDSNSI